MEGVAVSMSKTHGGAGAVGDAPAEFRAPRSDVPFLVAVGAIGGSYVVLIVGMLVADACYTTPNHVASALASAKFRRALWLTLVSCSVTAVLSLVVAVPLGYILSRFRFRGKWLVDALLDIPIVLPPLVVGLCLLILFQTPPGKWFHSFVPVTFKVPSVVIAQFAVAAAFAVRTMRVTFDEIPKRREEVALTLGCGRAQAFWRVALPDARRGLVTAGTLAWARALGEFGPLLVFVGIGNDVLVLSTAVWTELEVGSLNAGIAMSLLMVVVAMIVLVVVRVFGTGKSFV